MTIAAAASLLVTASLAAPAASANLTTYDPDGSGGFSQDCGYSHTNKDDPILGLDDEAHTHDWYGNPDADADSTPASLRGILSSPVTCNREQNQSAYWSPALYLKDPVTGEMIVQVPSRERGYYRVSGINQNVEEVGTLPENFGMIAGNAASQGAQSSRYVEFGCVIDGRDDAEDPGEQTIPDDCAGTPPGGGTYTGELRMRIYFPNCWDGVTEPWATGGKEHMRYAWEKGNHGIDQSENPKRKCPKAIDAGGTVDFFPIPELTMGVRWQVGTEEGTLIGALLESDIDQGHGVGEGGFTAHADFMNGWDQDYLQLLIDQCLHTETSCHDNFEPIQPIDP